MKFNLTAMKKILLLAPQGLFYDLRDVTNEAGTPVLDQVSGYTNQQMFGAFQSNIYTLQDYRVKLLQTTTNSTS